MAEHGKNAGIRITSDPDQTRVHQPSESGATEMIQLPLRLLYVADLNPGDEQTDWEKEGRVESIDRNSFADYMRRQNPALAFEVTNRLSKSPPVFGVELSFDELDSFRPERIIGQVPPLATLLEIRKSVKLVQDGAISVQEFRGKVTEAGADPDWAEQLYNTLKKAEAPARQASQDASAGRSPQKKGDDPVDRLLSMVDAGDDSADEQSSDGDSGSEAGFVGVLMDAVSEGGTPENASVEAGTVAALVSDLDEVIGSQLNAIINHPALRSLEAAWRGLKFLVDRMDFRRGVKLDVLAAGRTDLPSALYHQVLLPEHQREEGAPLSAVILAHTFGKRTDDLEILDDLMETGASLQAPVVGGVAPAFFGIEKEPGLNRIPLLSQHLKGPEYLAWNVLRRKDEAKFLALVVPPFLLRYPYVDTDGSGDFRFEEEGHLWGSGALLAAAAMSKSFVATGWPTHISREEMISDLPVAKLGSFRLPLAASLSDGKLKELADAGFVALSCMPNRDEVAIRYAPTVKEPDQYEEAEATAEARTHATLECQMFVARIAHFLLYIQNTLDTRKSPENIEQDVRHRLSAYLKGPKGTVPEEAVNTEHVPDANVPGRELYGVRIKPPPHVLKHPVSLVLGLQVAKETL